jgi:hypothetical protein
LGSLAADNLIAESDGKAQIVLLDARLLCLLNAEADNSRGRIDAVVSERSVRSQS